MATWVATCGNQIPANAVRGGYEADGRPLFVARATYDGECNAGKAGPHLNGCHLPYDGKERIVDQYEVLVHSTTDCGFLDWRQASGGACGKLDGAFCVERGPAYYVARATHKGSLIPGKLHTSHGCTYLSYGGDETSVKEYEILYQRK